MAIEKKVTEQHLEKLFRQQKTALRRKSLVLEFAEEGADAGNVELILCVRDVPPTFAATLRARNGSLVRDLDGHFEFEYEQKQYLQGVEFPRAVVGTGLPGTLATVEAFATKNGIPHVRSLGRWKGDTFIFHVWLGHELGEETTSFNAVENEWARLIGKALSQWSKDHGEPVRNALLYWGAEDHTGLEVIYVNDPALDADEVALGRLLRGSDWSGGEELELDEDQRPSFDDLPAALKKNRNAFLARLCARLESKRDFKPKSSAAPTLRVFSRSHDSRRNVDLALLNKARASLDTSADVFIAAEGTQKPART